MLGNETCRKACTFYMVSEQAKIGVSGEEQIHAAVTGKPALRLLVLEFYRSQIPEVEGREKLREQKERPKAVAV